MQAVRLVVDFTPRIWWSASPDLLEADGEGERPDLGEVTQDLANGAWWGNALTGMVPDDNRSD